MKTSMDQSLLSLKWNNHNGSFHGMLSLMRTKVSSPAYILHCIRIISVFNSKFNMSNITVICFYYFEESLKLYIIFNFHLILYYFEHILSWQYPLWSDIFAIWFIINLGEAIGRGAKQKTNYHCKIVCKLFWCEYRK